MGDSGSWIWDDYDNITSNNITDFNNICEDFLSNNFASSIFLNG